MKNQNGLIFGKNPVIEALKVKQVTKLFLANNFKDEKILSLVKEQQINPVYLPMEELNKRCAGVHQGVLAEVKKYEYVSMDFLLKKAQDLSRPIFVMLDGITDPHNFGAILRSCDVFGVTGVIIHKHDQVFLNATVAKTSAGAINYVPVSVVNNLNQTIRLLKENGFWIVSSSGEAKTDYRKIKYDFKTVLVIGSEGKGISSLILRNSDFIVKIPHLGHVPCLNASVAAGVLLAGISGV